MDALAASFATLSLLAALVFWHRPHQRGYLLLSAVTAALAVLSKSPAVAVVPVVLLTLAASPPRRSAALSRLALWGGVFVLTVVLLWPMLWVNPLNVYQVVRFSIAVEGANPHTWGNFFLGRAVEAPGPLFYPVALALRTTPITLVGILLLPLAGGRGAGVRVLATLAGFVLLFTLAMSLFPKKFDRYLVPVFPALDILAAVGLAGALRLLVGLLRLASLPPRLAAALPPAITAVVGMGALVNAAWWHPHGILAFNQLLGGTERGAQTFLVGWGEGLEQAADWLNEQPDITGVVTVADLNRVINPYLRDGAFAAKTGADLPERAGYVVAYVSHVQRGLLPPYSAYYGHVPPAHVVRLRGIDYAWIYQVPQRLEHTPQVSFETGVMLHSYALEASEVRNSGTLTLTMQWKITTPPTTKDYLFVHVLDDTGTQVGQITAPLLDTHHPPSVWRPGRYVLWKHPLFLPTDIPPGRYWISIGICSIQDCARSRVVYPIPDSAPDDGPNVVYLKSFRL